MHVRRFSARNALVRTGAVGTVVLTSVLLAAPGASAAPAGTIPLDPETVEVSLRPRENVGMLPISSPPQLGTPTVTRVDHWWGGTADVSLPDVIDTSSLVVSLELAPTDGAPPTRTYSSTSAVPADDLVVDDLGNNRFVVHMPTYDPADGAFGTLVLAGLDTTAGAGVSFIDPLKYYFRFVGSGSQVHYLAPELVAVTQVTPTEVTAGRAFTLTVPHTSRLRALALGDLARMSLAFEALDGNGVPTGAAPIVMDSYSAGVSVTNSDIATVTLPARTPAGTYRLSIVDGAQFPVLAGTVNHIAITTMELQVQPVGYRSNTGWGESDEQSSTGVSPLVGIGAGMVLVAGVGAAMVLRPRRRSVATD